MHHPVKHKVNSTSVAVPSEGETLATQQGIKRKVLRKKDGESRVFDESFTSSESGEMFAPFDVMSEMDRPHNNVVYLTM